MFIIIMRVCFLFCKIFVNDANLILKMCVIYGSFIYFSNNK